MKQGLTLAVMTVAAFAGVLGYSVAAWAAPCCGFC